MQSCLSGFYDFHRYGRTIYRIYRFVVFGEYGSSSDEALIGGVADNRRVILFR